MKQLLVRSSAFLISFGFASAAFAQGTNFSRGSGMYFSEVKLFLYLAVFLLWVAVVNGVNVDGQKQKMDYLKYNQILFFSGLAGLLVFFLIPWFFAALPVALVSIIVPLGMYAKVRNEDRPPHEKILTPDHFIWMFKVLFKMKIADPEQDTKLSLVKYKALCGKDDVENKAIQHAIRNLDGYEFSQELLADAMKNRADQILLDVSVQQVGVRYLVDGFWDTKDSVERETGDPAVEVYKTLCGLNVEERRARQSGRFEGAYKKRKRTFRFSSQGTQSGERVLIEIISTSKKLMSLEELGMSDDMVKQIKERLIPGEFGMFIVSAPPQQGCTESIDSLVNALDRYMRSWEGFEDTANPGRDLENVTPNKFNSAAGESVDKLLPALIRKYPDAYMVRDIRNAETLGMLVGEEIAAGERLVITSVAAKETVEAPLRLLTLKDAQGNHVPPANLAKVLIGVTNQRLVRRLCDECKEDFEPDAALLQRLGIPEGRVEVLYKAHVPSEDNKKICEKCNGKGYRGRVAVFEFLPFDDRMKEVLAASPRLDVLRAEARKAGNRTLQEEGILLACRGITSLEELRRVLTEQ